LPGTTHYYHFIQAKSCHCPDDQQNYFKHNKLASFDV
jgi:hypothetical protein